MILPSCDRPMTFTRGVNVMYQRGDFTTPEQLALQIGGGTYSITSGVVSGTFPSFNDAGAAIVPASPGFYHRPETIADLVDQVVTKVLDRARIPSDLMRRWKTP